MSSPIAPLNRLEKSAVAAFFVLLAAVGLMVEYRSAFLTRRMGDLDVFLRAAWAVQTDADLYKVASENGWHYIYPPLYAILMTPLADPPKSAAVGGYVPYAISVAVCCLFSIVCLLAGVNCLASAIEEKAFPSQPRFCRRWWLLRLLPILVCFLPIAHTLMRGQVNVMVLAILCIAAAAWLRQKTFLAGGWLSLAIAIKVVPAYLLVYPLWKRDWRALAGCTAGLIVWMILLPGLAFGPERAVQHYRTYATVFLGPIFGIGEDDTNEPDITGVNSTDSISVKDALHNWIYEPKRPKEMHSAAKAAYVFLGVLMTFLTLRPRRDSTALAGHSFAGLILLMTIFSPVCHSHYLLFCLPTVLCALVGVWQSQDNLSLPWLYGVSFGVFFLTMAIAYLPGLEILKDRCAALFATLPLWALPTLQLWRTKPASGPSNERQAPRLAA